MSRALLGLPSMCALLLAGFVSLEVAPPLGWDEGWTLMVARNWVERGQYGRLLDGALVAPGLAAALPAVAPIALSFRLFGVGLWQGRLPGVVFTVAALVLLYYLVCRLYDRRVAAAALVFVLLVPGHVQFHPLFWGRQALAEMPMLFYLLAGYAFLLLALRRAWFALLAIVFWGIGLVTKAQALPFWTISLVAPLAVTLLRRKWRGAGLLAGGLFGALALWREFFPLQLLLLGGRTIRTDPVQGLYDVTALVLSVPIRLATLVVVLAIGLPVTAAVCYAAWQRVASRRDETIDLDLEIVRMALLALTGSWLAWYVLLSVGWPRYLFPAVFLGSVFVGVMVRDLTDGFSLRSVVSRLSDAVKTKRPNRQHAGALLIVVLTGIMLPFEVGTLKALSRFYTSRDNPVADTAAFLNANTAPGARIESYDSELFFLLERRYHYPPDQLHVELNRRKFLRQDVPIDYDPLAANPDYLVVGPFSRMWGIYDAALERGAFRRIRSYGRYDIYERAR